MKRGKHEALRRLSRGWTVPLALVMSLVMGSVAWADNLVVDGDGLVPIASSQMNLGNVCLDQTASGVALLAIQQAGGVNSQNVYAGGATVVVAAGAPSSPAVTQSLSDTSIVLPSDWVASGAYSSDTAASTVTATAQAPTGTKSATIQYTASGTRNVGGTLSRSVALTVNWTVIACDTTPPVISPNVVGTLGNNGWYTSDVAVSWTVSDAESAVSSSSGCAASMVNADTTGTTFTCSATSGGGTSSQSVTVKRDATAPVITGVSNPAPNGNGWNASDVTVSFACSDATSGIASCTSPVTLSGDGVGQSSTGIAVDLAGNSASATVADIDIDKTAPTISGSAAPAANANGWNKSNVTVSFSCSDSLSGVDSCPGDVMLSSEGAGQSASGSAFDKAGNSASATVGGINIDKTAPTISGSAAPAANANGWNKSNVTVSFSCSDSLSGVDSCPGDVMLSSEGAGQSASGSAFDKAGNSAWATVGGINIDKTAPAVAVTGATQGATYLLGSEPTLGCSTTDSLSGVEVPAALSVSGGPAVGAFTATCSGGIDVAGNAAAATSVSYTVKYDFAGFFRPVDMGGVVNVVKAGSGIPVKFSLGGHQGLSVFAAGFPKSTSVACPGGLQDVISEAETITAGSSSLSYDALTGQYNYVWKTDKAWSGCRRLDVQFVDGQTYSALFKFNK